MTKSAITVPKVLDLLEQFYGPQEATWPQEPYDFLVWWHCGYPASDAACEKGWEKLNSEIGIEPDKLLAALPEKLAKALKAGGMVPELRALRLKEIAMRVQNELGGDLRAALTGPVANARKLLKKFPNIADPGSDRILLFARIAPVPAVPSNCPHVLVRILHGRERENYGVTYREAQLAISAEVPEKLGARCRAFLLLKRHGQEICKRSKPRCDQCPVSASCAFFSGRTRGVPAAGGR
jgi:endonuclease III